MEENILEKRINLRNHTIPQVVSVTLKREDEASEQVIERQRRFLKLPEEIKEKLASHTTGEGIFKIGQDFGFDLEKTASIARLVRNYYFGEVKKEDFSKILAGETGLTMEEAEKLSARVVEEIINNKGKVDTKKIIKIKLKEAIRRYPEIGDQIISAISLKKKGQNDLVRATVKNWIDDYYQEMGAGKHDLMQRGDYLYHGENTRWIGAEERKRIAIIIKALEDGEEISVDEAEKKIVFETSEEEKKPIASASLKSNFHPIQKNGLEKKKVDDIMPKKNKSAEILEGEIEKKGGMEKINQKIQEEAAVSGGYFIKKREESRREEEILKKPLKKPEGNIFFKKPEFLTGKKEIKKEEEKKEIELKKTDLNRRKEIKVEKREEMGEIKKEVFKKEIRSNDNERKEEKKEMVVAEKKEEKRTPVEKKEEKEAPKAYREITQEEKEEESPFIIRPMSMHMKSATKKKDDFNISSGNVIDLRN